MTCTNPVVVDNRKWMLTRIESRGFSSEKQSGLIYFMKYIIFLHAIFKLTHIVALYIQQI